MQRGAVNNCNSFSDRRIWTASLIDSRRECLRQRVEGHSHDRAGRHHMHRFCSARGELRSATAAGTVLNSRSILCPAVATGSWPRAVSTRPPSSCVWFRIRVTRPRVPQICGMSPHECREPLVASAGGKAPCLYVGGLSWPSGGHALAHPMHVQMW